MWLILDMIYMWKWHWRHTKKRLFNFENFSLWFLWLIIDNSSTKVSSIVRFLNLKYLLFENLKSGSWENNARFWHHWKFPMLAAKGLQCIACASMGPSQYKYWHRIKYHPGGLFLFVPKSSNTIKSDRIMENHKQ